MKKAFTLTEILITVTIIGIIASLMMSQLSKVKPDENAMLYKKAFYTIQDVVRALANDVDKYPDSIGMFATMPTNASEQNYHLYFCNLVYNELNTVGPNNCGNNNTPDMKLTNGIWIYDLNQTFDNEDNDNATPDSITICVDVNGSKAPNAGCDSNNIPSKNRDQYRIRINVDGKVTTDASWDAENAILENTGIITK